MQALSRHGELTLVLRPMRMERMEIEGKSVVEVKRGIRLVWNALGERAEMDEETGEYRKRYGFESPLMPAYRGRKTVRGVLDIESEAERQGVDAEWLKEQLRAHPANIANGGRDFVLTDEERVAEKGLAGGEVFTEKDDGVYCHACEKSLSKHHLAKANHEKSKAHQKALKAWSA